METVYRPTFLIMVTAANNNKYYRMLPKDDGTFDVEYGRVGAAAQHANYSLSQWNKKYREKVRKGYTDQTELMNDLIHEEKEKGPKQFKEIENKVIAEIVERLQDMATKTIQKNYRVDSLAVTQAMVDEAQEHIDKMANRSNQYTVREFNDALIILFGIIPRRMSEVSDYLASDESEFSKILSREQDLLDVMKGQVIQHKITEAEDENDDTFSSNETILDAMELVFEECTDEDISHIKELMGEAAGRLLHAWKVTNLKTQKRFDEFVAEEGIADIREFWHGSGNANWWSIIGNGLYLRPTNVKISGKMLGYGLYFANNVVKSITYTSRSPYSWNHEPTGFLAIMQVAYGKPYNIDRFDSKYYEFDYQHLQKACPGAHCLHAHKDMDTGWGRLRNDEIVVYREEQATIKYLVEFA